MMMKIAVIEGITPAVQTELERRITVFNEKRLAKSRCKFSMRIKGKFIYMMRAMVDGRIEPICRLTYTGDLDNMAFAIFRWSTEKYDPSAMFPGDECLDGTIEGAMKACSKAYPA